MRLYPSETPGHKTSDASEVDGEHIRSDVQDALLQHEASSAHRVMPDSWSRIFWHSLVGQQVLKLHVLLLLLVNALTISYKKNIDT